MGADMIGGSQLQSNQFLPFGKVRMGYPLGRSGWVILGEGQDGLSFGKVRMGLRSGWVLD